MQCGRIQRGTPLEAKGNEEEEERGKKKRKRGKKDEHGEKEGAPPDSKPISGIVMQQLTRYELW